MTKLTINNNNNAQAIGQLGLMILFCTLLTLKVSGPLATVSWWIITLPLWAPFAVVAVIGLIILALIGVTQLLLKLERRKMRKRVAQVRAEFDESIR